MLCAPNAISPEPPTDGAFFHEHGVPLMHFLAAPFYLFDAMDTLDKIDAKDLDQNVASWAAVAYAIAAAARPTSSAERHSFTPPALPRPPAWTCALTTQTGPGNSRAAATASASLAAALPAGTGTP